MLEVELIYLSKTKNFHQHYAFKAPVTIKTVIVQSSFLETFPDLRLESLSLGVFSQSAALTDLIKDGDRIEIYRPLNIDPKKQRLLRSQNKL